MNSIRKWLYKPKKTDKSLLAQFYFADEDLNRVAAELDSFDSRKDPERCQALVTQLRACQDKVLTIVQRMMVEAIPYARTSRDFRVKFPDDVVQENLAGQLWFGAECLAAGSSIMNREIESAAMRPLARALTKNLDSLRHILRDQCLVNINEYTERIREALTIFDKLFAEFELSYVSAMVPVKSVKEYETIQEITVLFSETVIRAQSLGYITTDMIDEYDPALMFTIPRLAIVCGLLLFLDGPLNPDSQSWNMSDMFRPFQTLLYKIRELLFTLSVAELSTLERALCSQEEPDFLSSNTPQGSNNTSSSSSTITTTSSTTTTTTGVQTDSPVLKKVRPNNDSSCSSLDKLGSDCSDSLSLPVEQGQRTGCMEDIVCQSDRAPDAPSPDAVFCESESVTVEPQNTSSSLRQERNLNKSDSNDSGLHSDVISTSDSQFTISSSDSIQLLSNSALPSPLLSPSMDEVVELCMEQAGNAETSADDNHRSCEEGLNSCDQGKDTECSNSMECAVAEKSAVDSCQTVCGSAAAGKEEDDDDDEEENFYTPSSGVSPLHQPSSESAAVKVPELAASQVKSVAELLTVSHSSADTGSASHSQVDAVHEQTESVNKYTGDVEGRSDSGRTNPSGFDDEGRSDGGRTNPSGFDDEDDNKENCGQRVADLTMSSCSAEDVSHLPARQLRGVLQKVQAIFAPDESETVEAHAMGSGGSDLSDSPLTDATLTDLTPQAHLDAMLTGSADLNLTAHNTPHVHLPPRDDTSLALPSQTSDCASVSRCDTDNGACTLKASCDIEPQNQNIPSETGCVSHAGATNLDANCTENAGGCDTSAEMNRCDRCTQTPHSAINNDQSSKIHHHHHHHRRQHSNPSTASSASSLSPHRTPKGTTNKKQDKSKKRDDKTESSKAHRSAAANSNSTTQTGNLQSVEKSQQVGGGSKKSLGGKTSKTSHKTQTHKCQGLKSQRDAAGSEARLKQYADNWSDCSSHSQHDAKGRKKKEKKLTPNVMETSSGSSCEGSSSTSDCESDQDSCGSSETSSYNSESHDDEEIALAVQAAELANRNQARARFRSSSDMIHRLFVCISGVADQLQTNFAGDLRNILRVVFNLNCSEPVMMEDEKSFRRYRRRGARFFHQQFGQDVPPNRSLRDAPTWIPDDQSPMCMSCKTPFTFVRRRHHCRNCGKIFCGRCSSNAVSLPHFGHTKPVRVCNHCFVFQVNPFAVQARV